MEKYEFQVSTINAVLDYLSKRPYAEVFQLIHAIQQDADNYEKEQEKSNGRANGN